MLVKSMVFSQMSGSIGGLTAAHNSAGLYVRARTIPVNPNSTSQQEVRSTLASLTSGWSALTDAQRESWAVYAANVPLIGPTGDARPVGAINQYIRSNVPRLAATLAASSGSLPQVDTGPAVFDVGSFSPVTITVNGATGIASIAFTNTDDWANEDDAALIIQGGPPVNPTVNFFKAPFRYPILPFVLGDSVTPPTSPATFVPAFPAITGQRQYFRVRASRADGRLSAAQIVSAIAT